MNRHRAYTLASLVILSVSLIATSYIIKNRTLFSSLAATSTTCAEQPVMSRYPQPVYPNQSITFSITNGIGDTWYHDSFGGVNCTSWTWPSKTCTTTTVGTFTWTHYWKNCVGDINNCSVECSKSTTYTISQITPPTATPTHTPASTSTPIPTQTPTQTPTLTPASTPTPGSSHAEPNSCGGTCGSNSNCASNLFCHTGFCRNPLCGDSPDCSCTAPTPTRVPTPRPTSRPRTTSAPKPGVTVSPTPSATPTLEPTPQPTIFLVRPETCIQPCSSNDACDPALICFSGYCRNPLCITNSNCSCSNDLVPTPTPANLAPVTPPVKKSGGSGSFFWWFLLLIIIVLVVFIFYRRRRYQLPPTLAQKYQEATPTPDASTAPWPTVTPTDEVLKPGEDVKI